MKKAHDGDSKDVFIADLYIGVFGYLRLRHCLI